MRSGAQTTHNKLVSFLYNLVHAYIPPCVIEELVNNQALPCTMTNG